MFLCGFGYEFNCCIKMALYFIWSILIELVLNPVTRDFMEQDKFYAKGSQSVASK